MTLHLLPSTPVATPDRLPLSRLRVRRPQVLHGEPVIVCGHVYRFPVAQRGLSNRVVTAPTPEFDRATVDAITAPINPPARMVRAVVETLNTVTESGLTPSTPAPKAIVTVPRPFPMQPRDQERAGLSVSTTVRSDGLFVSRHGGDRLSRSGKPQENSRLCAVPSATGGTSTPTVHRLNTGRLISPWRVEIEMAQTENVTYRLAESVRTLRRRHLHVATRDGVLDAEEAAIDAALLQITDDLEQKADDERAAIALLRTGRTKRTRGIVVELFPQIGPEAA